MIAPTQGKSGSPSSSPSPRRAFRLGDALLLVAIVALMLGTPRAVWALGRWADVLMYYREGVVRHMACGLALVIPSLVLGPAMLVRRDDRRRLRGGAPGLLVHLVVLLAFAVRLAGWAVLAVVGGTYVDRLAEMGFNWGGKLLGLLHDAAWPDVAIGVATSWLALAVVGRWRPDRSWDDRLGRLIGLAWVVGFLIAPILESRGWW
jgi:hypothetical protein